jgi:hypothetical protein
MTVAEAVEIVCDTAEDRAMDLTGSDDALDEADGWLLAEAIEIVRAIF